MKNISSRFSGLGFRGFRVQALKGLGFIGFRIQGLGGPEWVAQGFGCRAYGVGLQGSTRVVALHGSCAKKPTSLRLRSLHLPE